MPSLKHTKMKRIILVTVLALTIISCGGKKQDQKTVENEVETTDSESSEIRDEFKKGADLIAANDCMACHNIDSKIVGPSYKEIAAKYSTMDEATLAQSIIEGGSGKWGEVPMTAHPTLSKEDATEMVHYILSLK